MTAGQTVKPVRIAYIQALRGLAALWVVLYHAREHTPAFGWLFDGGHYGVAIFFALSGFVIMHSIADAEITPGFWGRFMLRRSIRLDPAYWLAIAFTLALALVSARVKGENFDPPSLANLGAHILYIQEYLRFEQINPVFWTLTFEVQFYAFLVAMLLLPGAMPVMFALACASALGIFDGIHPALFLNLWGAFFVGVLARMSGSAAAVGVGTLAALLALRDTFGLIAATTAIGLCWAWRTRRGGLTSGPLQQLGNVSYSLYLLHVPVSGAAAFIAIRLFGTGLGGQVLTLLAIVGASIAAAAVAYVAIERPSHRLSRKVPLAKPIAPMVAIA